MLKYEAPDYELVTLDVTDSFAANYSVRGCPEDEMAGWSYTIPCEGTDNYKQVYYTFTQWSWNNCYSTLNP